MSKTCFYRMTYDGGSAPNPFHGWCTLAICTPNHARANLDSGDYIVGVEGVTLRRQRITLLGGDATETRLQLLYIMRVAEVLTLEKYFEDPRFAAKKAEPRSRNPVKMMGDNVYFKGADGKWSWIRGHIHDSNQDSNRLIEQDQRGNRVFIASDFVYFGRGCIDLPDPYQQFVPLRGLKYMRDDGLGDALFAYAQKQAGDVGQIGLPISMQTGGSC